MRGFPRTLGEAGAAVALTARREEGLQDAVTHLTEVGIRAMSVRCDISRNEQVEAATKAVLDQLDHIDILVNNAGATWGASFEELPFEAWDKVVRTNVDGTYFVSRAVGLHMIKRGMGGRIINIGSVAGLRGSDPRVMPTLPYNTSKGAVVNFTRALAMCDRTVAFEQFNCAATSSAGKPSTSRSSSAVRSRPVSEFKPASRYA